jgi:hypothetical protein
MEFMIFLNRICKYSFLGSSILLRHDTTPLRILFIDIHDDRDESIFISGKKKMFRSLYPDSENEISCVVD